MGCRGLRFEQGTRVLDPDSFHADPDPRFQIFVDPDPYPGFKIFEDRNPDPGFDLFNKKIVFVREKI